MSRTMPLFEAPPEFQDGKRLGRRPRPTRYPPGTAAKVEVLAARFAAGRALFCDADATLDTMTAGQVRRWRREVRARHGREVREPREPGPDAVRRLWLEGVVARRVVALVVGGR